MGRNCIAAKVFAVAPYNIKQQKMIGELKRVVVSAIIAAAIQLINRQKSTKIHRKATDPVATDYAATNQRSTKQQ